MPKLFWIDLETTGLSPHKNKILEVAWAMTDLSTPFDVDTLKVRSRPIRFAAEDRWKLSPFIVDMHTRNSLLDVCASAAAVELSYVEDELMQTIPIIDDKAERVILAGSSVHFDKRFLHVHMPKLATRFSHRIYDVSSVKLFCQSLGMPKIGKAEAHVAAHDLLESVEHAKKCAEWLKEWGDGA